MHPKCVLTIDGVPVAGAVLERLIRVVVTDKEGTRSDTIDIELEAGPPYLAIPRKKALIRCWLGYVETGIEYMGTFEAEDPELLCLPYKMMVQGKATGMRGAMKEHQERHWDGQTFGGVVNEMASEAGLTAQVDPEIAAFAGKDGYFAQEGESNLHWIERQAQRLNGLFAVKEGRLIVAKKGAGLTAAGAAIGAIVVTPSMIVTGSCRTKFTCRDEHKEVRAGWHDQEEGQRKYETAPGSPDGEVTHTLRHTFANKDEAKRAAESRGKELTRSADTTSVTIEGLPYAKGGAPMSYAGVHPEIDGLPWVIETGTHTYSKGGYTTDIQAKAQK